MKRIKFVASLLLFALVSCSSPQSSSSAKSKELLTLSYGINGLYATVRSEENPSLRRVYYSWGGSVFPKMLTDNLDCASLVPGDNVELMINTPRDDAYNIEIFPSIWWFGPDVEFVSVSVTKGIVKQIELVDGYPSGDYELPYIDYSPCEYRNEFVICADGSIRSSTDTETVYACFHPSNPKKIEGIFECDPATLDSSAFLLMDQIWIGDC